MTVRPATDADQAWGAAFDEEAWGGPLVARLGELIDLRDFPALVATLDGTRAGIARRARHTIKPSLPERGSSGIRMAHELELELAL